MPIYPLAEASPRSRHIDSVPGLPDGTELTNKRATTCPFCGQEHYRTGMTLLWNLPSWHETVYWGKCSHCGYVVNFFSNREHVYGDVEKNIICGRIHHAG